MTMIDIEQRSDQWKQIRCGKVTASRIADLMARTKSGPSASRANYLAELLVERLTGVPTEGYTNAAMQRGTDLEPVAREAYELSREMWVSEIGFVVHPRINDSGASPDGLCAADGLVEIKCMGGANHLDVLLRGEIPDKYIKQMQWQMACCERAWCDFAAFHPGFPSDMQLFVKRVPRDDALIAEMEREVSAFLAELDEKLGQLQHRFARAA